MNKPKILIVDDGESQRFVLKGFLLREGYMVDEAENGIKALQCVKDQHFDIITKPVELDKLLILLDHISKRLSLKKKGVGSAVDLCKSQRQTRPLFLFLYKKDSIEKTQCYCHRIT